LGLVPAAVQLLCGLAAGLPETPRWLVKAGRVEKAREVLGKVYGADEDGRRVVNEVLRRVVREIEEEDRCIGKARAGNGIKARMGRVRARFAELMKDGNRRALLIACMLQGAQQLCGFVRTPHALIPFRSLRSAN
jgi:SP family myo-inositol transporter-like MFS transporter 13